MTGVTAHFKNKNAATITRSKRACNNVHDSRHEDIQAICKQAARMAVQLLSAKWVVPGEGEGKILEDHTVVVQGDTILEIIPTAACAAKYPGLYLRGPSGNRQRYTVQVDTC